MAKKVARKAGKPARKAKKTPTFKADDQLFDSLMAAFHKHGIEPVLEWVCEQANWIAPELDDKKEGRPTAMTSWEIMTNPDAFRAAAGKKAKKTAGKSKK